MRFDYARTLRQKTMWGLHDLDFAGGMISYNRIILDIGLTWSWRLNWLRLVTSVTSEVFRMEVFEKSNMILIWFRYDFALMICCGLVLQVWFVKLWFWSFYYFVCFFWANFAAFFEHVLNTYQIHISESYQHHIEIVSKRNDNHIKIFITTFQKWTKNMSRGCFCFFFPSQPSGNPKKTAAFPNHIEIMSKATS